MHLLQDFVSTVDQVFPHCTIVLNEALPALSLSTGVSQRLAVHVSSASQSSREDLQTALTEMDTFDIILETESFKTLVEHKRDGTRNNVYVMSKQS